jgi:hypothetical protein
LLYAGRATPAAAAPARLLRLLWTAIRRRTRRAAGAEVLRPIRPSALPCCVHGNGRSWRSLSLSVRRDQSITREPGLFIRHKEMGLMWCTGSASCVVFLVHGEPCAYMGDHHLCVYRFRTRHNVSTERAGGGGSSIGRTRARGGARQPQAKRPGEDALNLSSRPAVVFSCERLKADRGTRRGTPVWPIRQNMLQLLKPTRFHLSD